MASHAYGCQVSINTSLKDHLANCSMLDRKRCTFLYEKLRRVSHILYGGAQDTYSKTTVYLRTTFKKFELPRYCKIVFLVNKILTYREFDDLCQYSSTSYEFNSFSIINDNAYIIIWLLVWLCFVCYKHAMLRWYRLSLDKFERYYHVSENVSSNCQPKYCISYQRLPL